MKIQNFCAWLGMVWPLVVTAQIPTPGGLDTNFVPATYSSDVFWALAVQPNGTILAAGREGSSTIYGVVTRLTTNGSIDSTFPSGPRATCTDATIPQINSISLQTNGAIILGGAFTYFDTPSRLRLAQLTASGTLDTTFTPSAGNTVFSTAVQPDGKIVIAGGFVNFKGSGKNYLARINADGSVDATFNPQGSGPDNRVLTVALAPNGNLVIGGDFSSVNGQPRGRVARLLNDGSVDPNFDPNGGADDTVEGVAIQADGKVMAGGWFYNISGTPRSRIARLNANGSLDTTFDPGTGANSRVYAFAFQAEKILAVGRFTSYNNTNRAKIVRLNPDGTIDPTFDPLAGSGTSSTDEIRTVKLQTDGSILVGGKFTTFSGQPRNGIARLYPDSITNQPPQSTLLVMRPTRDGMALDWTGKFILQRATNVAGPYEDIQGATNPPATVINRTTSEFFRLRSH